MRSRTGYTTDEAADRLGVSSKTIRRYLASGRLSGVRLSPSGIWRIDRASVAALAAVAGRVLEPQRATVLVILGRSGNGPAAAARWAAEAHGGPWRVTVADELCLGLLQLGLEPPDLLLLDHPPPAEVERLTRAIQCHGPTAAVKILILVNRAEVAERRGERLTIVHGPTSAEGVQPLVARMLKQA